MLTISFTAHGKPAGQPRARFNPTTSRRPYNSRASRASKGEVLEAFVQAVPDPESWKPWEGPVSLACEFVMLQPGEWWPGKECTRTPDLDNLAKLVQDALNGEAYRDDAQIIQMELAKSYGPRQETRVTLTFWPKVEKPKKARKGGEGRKG